MLGYLICFNEQNVITVMMKSTIKNSVAFDIISSNTWFFLEGILYADCFKNVTAEYHFFPTSAVSLLRGSALRSPKSCFLLA
jgi:hypothetical protein